MAEFREWLAELGYGGVATVLNSGNAVFQASKKPSAQHASDIAAMVAARLKLDVRVIVKPAGEWGSIVAGNPLVPAADESSRLLVAFVQDPKSLSRLEPVRALVVPPERFAVGENAAYLLCPHGILDSKAGEALLSGADGTATTRNWATVLKLQALAGEPDARSD